jgi:hypothetical protein
LEESEMTYAVRNTFFIAAFWAAILAGGFFYVYGYQQKSLEKAQKNNTIKRQRLQDLLALEKDCSALRQQLSGLDDFRQGNMGTIAAKESPGETFDYLLRELSRTGSKLDVNFSFKSQDTFLSLARRTYEIKGSGSFLDFYNMLCLLEAGPVFYDVHQIEMNTESGEPDQTSRGEVNFSIEFNGYNRAEGPAITGISAAPAQSQQIADLVNGRSSKAGGRIRARESAPVPAEPKQAVIIAPPKNTEGLPEIDGNTKILAIMPGAAVLKDQNGRTVRLRQGDRVWGGTLNEINTQQGTLSFSLQDASGSATSLVLLSGSN